MLRIRKRSFDELRRDGVSLDAPYYVECPRDGIDEFRALHAHLKDSLCHNKPIVLDLPDSSEEVFIRSLSLYMPSFGPAEIQFGIAPRADKVFVASYENSFSPGKIIIPADVAGDKTEWLLEAGFEEQQLSSDGNPDFEAFKQQLHEDFKQQLRDGLIKALTDEIVQHVQPLFPDLGDSDNEQDVTELFHLIDALLDKYEPEIIVAALQEKFGT